MKNRLTMSGSLVILFGFVGSFFFVLMKSLERDGSILASWFYDVGIALSIGLITTGALSIVLGLKDWQEYFQQRLSEVIRQKDYIKRLNKEELVQLQRDTFRAYFGLDGENSENSFITYFERELQHLIGSPYREDINTFMNIKEHGDEGVKVEETIRFRAKSVAGNIQSSVNWIAAPEEYLEFHSGTVKIRPAKPFTDDVCVDDDGYYELAGDEIEILGDNLGFKASLSKHVDNIYLDVLIHASYTANPNRYLSWTMSQLTDRFTITIEFPENMVATHEVLGINSGYVQVNKGKSTVTIKCNTWALPNTGIVLGLTHA